MPKQEPERELRVLVNKAEKKIEIVGLTDGAVSYSIEFTLDRAEQHALALIEAIEMAHAAHGSKKRLLTPGHPAFN